LTIDIHDIPYGERKYLGRNAGMLMTLRRLLQTPHGAHMNSRVLELLAIMARLRAADGCPWDRQQTFAASRPIPSRRPTEVADAIERGDMGDLKDELGDLLFQVVFHAQMAREAGHFDFEAVAAAVCDKLTRRHPHVFGDHGPLSIAEQRASLGDIKAGERGAADPSALQDVPNALPALMRATSSASAPRASVLISSMRGSVRTKSMKNWPRFVPRRRVERCISGDLRGNRRSAVRGGEPGAQARCRRGGCLARRQRKIRASISRHGSPRGGARLGIRGAESGRTGEPWQAVKRGE